MIDPLDELIELVSGSAPLMWAATCDQVAAHRYEKAVEAFLDRLRRDRKPFQHFKGGIYQVIGRAQLVTHGANETLVLYQSAESEGPVHTHVYARTESDWSEPVTWPDGQVRARFLPMGDAP